MRQVNKEGSAVADYTQEDRPTLALDADGGVTYGPFKNIAEAVRYAGLHDVATGTMGTDGVHTPLEMLKEAQDGRDSLMGDLIDSGWQFVDYTKPMTPAELVNEWKAFHPGEDITADLEKAFEEVPQ